MPASATRAPVIFPAPTEPSALDPTTKKTITVMLIGQTGSGKTTFLSLLANLFNGHKYDQLVDMNDSSKESGKPEDQSQTTEPTLYILPLLDDKELRILDTPGLADTGGIEKDRKHKEAINNILEAYITNIDAVLILSNGTSQRHEVTIRYTLQVIMTMFPASIAENICFIFTKSTSIGTKINTSTFPGELKNTKPWKIENPLATYKNYQALVKEGKTPAKKLTRDLGVVKYHYDDAVDTLNEWLTWLDSRKPQGSKAIIQLYETFVRIDSRIQMALTNHQALSKERAELEQVKRNLGTAQTAKESYDKLVADQKKLRWEDVYTDDRFNTVCSFDDCYSNCHVPCNATHMATPDAIATECIRFGPSTSAPATTLCDICNHAAIHHKHQYFIKVQRPGKVDPETERKYEAATSEEERVQALKDGATNRITAITQSLATNQAEILRLISQFNTNSFSKSFAGHINTTMDMLNLQLEELITKPEAEAAAQREIIKKALKQLQLKLDTINGRYNN